MTALPLTIVLRRAYDRAPITVDVPHIRYIHPHTDNQAPISTIVLPSGSTVVQESVWDIQQRCLGC